MEQRRDESRVRRDSDEMEEDEMQTDRQLRAKTTEPSVLRRTAIPPLFVMMNPNATAVALR